MGQQPLPNLLPYLSYAMQSLSRHQWLLEVQVHTTYPFVACRKTVKQFLTYSQESSSLVLNPALRLQRNEIMQVSASVSSRPSMVPHWGVRGHEDHWQGSATIKND